VIAKEDLGDISPGATPLDFNVDDKIAHNGLSGAAGVIEDYKIFYPVVDRIYTEFDNNALNKSKSVLDAFRLTYHKLSGSHAGDELFFQIVEEVITKVRNSSNYIQIPLEELQLCVNVLAVDAFIRCKIFKNPSGVAHAAA
jgi:arginine decarboxylase-like protein